MTDSIHRILHLLCLDSKQVGTSLPELQAHLTLPALKASLSGRLKEHRRAQRDGSVVNSSSRVCGFRSQHPQARGTVQGIGALFWPPQGSGIHTLYMHTTGKNSYAQIKINKKIVHYKPITSQYKAQGNLRGAVTSRWDSHSHRKGEQYAL